MSKTFNLVNLNEKNNKVLEIMIYDWIFLLET
jgi:hypothetical protein